MKKVRVLFASAACMVAVAGVFAKTSSSRLGLATVFYVPSSENYTTSLPSCVNAVIPAACTTGTLVRCVTTFSYGGTIGSPTVKISKRVDSGPCVIAQKD